MSLKEIFCQDKALSILNRAFAADKVAHAYIFAGIEGVGKFKTAREWAKLLLCKNPVIEKSDQTNFADSCGSCESCTLFEADSHPDFNHVYKELVQFTEDGKDKKTPVDLPKVVVKEFLIEKVPSRPTLSQRKVFVVSGAERLNIASQNSLLKVLEEPPEYCCIVLLCTRLERLLPTTRSRCQTIRFSPIAEQRIIDKLKQIGAEQTQAKYFARLARGSLGRACQWTQLELAGANIYHAKNKLLISLAQLEYADSLELAQEFLAASKEIAENWAKLDEVMSKTDINRRAAKTVVEIIISALYDTMKLNIAAESELINFDQKKQIEKLTARFGPEAAGEKIADAYETMRWIDASVNEKLIFERLLLNLADSDTMAV